MRLLIILSVLFALTAAAGEKIPHAQKEPPGPALTAQEAMAKMILPEGFKVELCVSEPEIVNPTSMTFDERGRIWITESIEYPRPSAGPGKDRIKILEDTDGDGKYEKVTIFKDGLNIPCGVVMGNGGVYVTNSPDVLFLQDTDGDGVADKEEVILTGFGRSDRHELPNNLIWGPDGWLYFMNGVFNPSTVVFDGKTHKLTCGVFRYHPKWKKFEVFAEGSSNPWGLDYNLQGDWFLTCCVIDHMFHITQSGYYHRQGGQYPQFMEKQQSYSKSIVTQKHQQAAYSGLCIYNADVFPEEYRGRFLMGNLHGSCLNYDVVTKNGSTYTQKGAPDFLSANDKWFMPVAQKVGPDGCLYVMDWYDRYHCYQDANRDSPGLDRTRGRIYRISYKDAPRSKPFNLGKSTKEELLGFLSSPNVWWRREAQRQLNEKFVDAPMIATLQKMALNDEDKTQARIHALWLLCSQPSLDADFHMKLLTHADPVVRNWGVRAIGQNGKPVTAIYEKLKALAADPAPEVRLQVTVAAGRLLEADPLPVLFAMLSNIENAADPLIPHIVFNNLRPLATLRSTEISEFLEKKEMAAVWGTPKKNVISWITQVMNATKNPATFVADIKKQLAAQPVDEKKIAAALFSVIDAFNNASMKSTDRTRLFDEGARAAIGKLAAGNGDARLPATIVALWWNDPQAFKPAVTVIADLKAEVPVRIQLIKAVSESKEPAAFEALAAIAAESVGPQSVRKEALEALANSDNPKVTSVFLASLKNAPSELKAIIIRGLIRNAASANALIEAMEKKEVPNSELNSNHVRQILELKDPALSKRVVAAWGTVRTDRDPERVEVIKKMRAVVAGKKGAAVAGWKVFEAKCQQCHTIYGKGADVGPDLTGVGRQTLDAVLTNVLDPNLEVGKPYYQYIAKTKDGKIITGILAEESDQRVVLKREGGILESVARGDLEKLVPQTLSLMPEGLEKNMTEQEFVDLVEFMLTTAPPKR